MDNCVGINASRSVVEALIAEEASAGIAADRVVLAGFSQGGALALYTGLQRDIGLAGVLVMGGFLPAPSAIVATAAGKGTPIAMLHGVDDRFVLHRWAVATTGTLRSWGCTNVSLQSYPGLGHAASSEVRTVEVSEHGWVQDCTGRLNSCCGVREILAVCCRRSC